MKNTIFRKKQRVAKREKKNGEKWNISLSCMISRSRAILYPHFEVLEQFGGIPQVLHAFWRYLSPKTYSWCVLKLCEGLFFLRFLNKRSNSKWSSKKSSIFIFFKRWYLKFAKLLSYNIPYWIEILVKKELR